MVSVAASAWMSDEEMRGAAGSEDGIVRAGTTTGRERHGDMAAFDALEAKLHEMLHMGQVGLSDFEAQLQLLRSGAEGVEARVTQWLQQRAAEQAAFRTGPSAVGKLLLLRSSSGPEEREVELEDQHVGHNDYFINFLAQHFGSTGSSLIVSRRWIPFCPTLLRFLYSPQPLFVEQLIFQKSLEDLLVVHHCALYFLATADFFTELFYRVNQRRDLLLEDLAADRQEDLHKFPSDSCGECFDIYHLPLDGILMWLVALEMPAMELVKVLSHSGDLDAIARTLVSPSTESIVAEIDRVLSGLFSLDGERWAAVLAAVSRMELSEQRETQERERRKEYLTHLHGLAKKMRSELSNTNMDLMKALNSEGAELDHVASTGHMDCEDSKKSAHDWTSSFFDMRAGGSSCSSWEAVADAAFGNYAQEAHGFAMLCMALGVAPDSFEALALSYCCGSERAFGLPPRDALAISLGGQRCTSVDGLRKLLQEMVLHVCSRVPLFWAWLFQVLVQQQTECREESVRPVKMARHRRSIRQSHLCVEFALPVLCSAAPCLHSPALLPTFTDFLRRESALRGLSFSADSWAMILEFFKRFPTIASLEQYDQSDGFPSLFDSFVVAIPRLTGVS